MLDNPRERKMTNDEAVAKGMAIFDKLEDLAKKAETAGAGLKPVFEAIRDNGVISDFECNALTLEAKAILLNFRAQLHIFHAKTTQRAQLKGIDNVITAQDGGPR
jgi:hypothetical protein